MSHTSRIPPPRGIPGAPMQPPTASGNHNDYENYVNMNMGRVQGLNENSGLYLDPFQPFGGRHLARNSNQNLYCNTNPLSSTPRNYEYVQMDYENIAFPNSHLRKGSNSSLFPAQNLPQFAGARGVYQENYMHSKMLPLRDATNDKYADYRDIDEFRRHELKPRNTPLPRPSPQMDKVHVYEEIDQVIHGSSKSSIYGSKLSSFSPDPVYSTSTPNQKKGLTVTDDIKSRKQPLKVLQSEGQVKIAVYMNFGLLTVHVVQARHLQSKWKPLCDSYVKMTLLPDDSRRTRCKTETILDSNNPLFDEKFSFELLEEDYSKRLMISVWHREHSKDVHEFLGCMSFGIRHLLNPKKEVSGWYYLLTDEIGRKKHLQVSSKVKPELKLRSQTNVPPVNTDIWGLEPITVTVNRGKHGFGFSVVDSCPVKVGRVDRASPAESAGLVPGDCVIKVNGQNVSRSQAVSVAKLVKMSGTTLILDLQRQQPIQTLDSSPWKQTGAFEQHDMRVGQDPRDSSEGSMSDCKENEISVDEGLLSLPSQLITSTPLPAFMNGHQTAYSAYNAERRCQEAYHRLLSMELDFIDYMHAGMQRFSRPLRHCILSQKQHSALFQNIEKVVTISEYHVKQINDNRPSMCSSDTDASLCSSENSHNFTQSIAMIYGSKLHMLCQAYDLYAKGLDDAHQVLTDLKKNTEFINFIKDPIPDPKQPSISSFICRPVQHINDLYHSLRDVFVNTNANSSDYRALKSLVEGLQECTSSITNYSCVARVQSLMSLTSGSASCHRSSCSSASSTDSSGSESGSSRRHILQPCNSMQSVYSTASELSKLMDRLAFSSGTKPVQLDADDRHLVYSGDLFKWDGRQWSKIYGLLFNDLILESERQRDNSLQVLNDPIFLSHISGIEGQRKHTTEFVLHRSTKRSGSFPGHGYSERLLYRAPDAEQKKVWQSLLEQKIFAVNGSLHHFNSSDRSASSAVIV